MMIFHMQTPVVLLQLQGISFTQAIIDHRKYQWKAKRTWRLRKLGAIKWIPDYTMTAICLKEIADFEELLKGE